MLRNLKGIYAERGDWLRALSASERVIALMPEDAGEEYRDRGSIYLELECMRAALGDFSTYLRQRPGAADAGASRETLAHLDRLNLFLLPLDSPPAWYRYHHLFGVLLRQRLGMLAGESIPALHARAAAWLEAHGYLDQALAHWLEAGEASQAGRLVQEHGLSLLNRGELLHLGDWMSRLPAEEIDSRPWLGVFQAWLMLLTGQIPGIPTLLQAAERHQPSPGDAAGHIAAIRAYLSAVTGDLCAVDSQAELVQSIPSIWF